MGEERLLFMLVSMVFASPVLIFLFAALQGVRGIRLDHSVSWNGEQEGRYFCLDRIPHRLLDEMCQQGCTELSPVRMPHQLYESTWSVMDLRCTI